MNAPRRGTPDFLLLFLTFALVCFGVVMVFSSSSVYAATRWNNSWLLTSNQIISVLIGTFCLLFTMNIRYTKLKKLVIPAFIIILILLVVVLMIAPEDKGARSRLKIGPLSMQPSEFAKIGIIMYLALLIGKKGEKIKKLKSGLLPAIIVTGFVSALIVVQPDVGTAAIFILTAFTVIFVGGARLKHLLILGGLGAAVITIFMGLYFVFDPQSASSFFSIRMARINTFLNPRDDMLGEGYQIMHALYALGHGGIMGTGFGQSIQKMYIPEPYNDFIFAIIAEEFGLIGSCLFLLIYIVFIWRGLIIAVRCPDTFGMLTGVGIMGMIGFQAIINIGGVIGAIPMTGVTLPLISYGGSSIMATLIGMGIVLSLSREQNRLEKKEKVEKVTQTTRVYR
ncbi:putative lipid II flippase FtsW [Paenibacillus sp. FJAT-26967]|uniref:putative lipid II flippase FtsW n=1 Tax=Paenibacillus sp. FJAT-26967 TaxID=1729690 RepID=UPI0008381056|nr:putative lipid II flippase FtsW [Paenibacillus sp. FJAT-26967]